MTVEADFHPVLKMYVNLDYQRESPPSLPLSDSLNVYLTLAGVPIIESEFMDGNVASVDPIWTCNIATLSGEFTNHLIVHQAQTVTDLDYP